MELLSILLLLLAVIGYICVPLLTKTPPMAAEWSEEQRMRLEKTLEQEIRAITRGDEHDAANVSQ